MKNKKIIVYIVIGLIVFLLILSSFSMINFNSNTSGNSNMPEKCRKPEGQDIESWKEHLGHHAETQECLKYFP